MLRAMLPTILIGFLALLIPSQTNALYNPDSSSNTEKQTQNQFIVKYKKFHDPQYLEKEVKKQDMKNKNILSRIKYMFVNISDQNKSSKELSQLNKIAILSGVTHAEIISKDESGLTYLYSTNGKKKYNQIVTMYEKLYQVEYVEPNYIYNIQTPLP